MLSSAGDQVPVTPLVDVSGNVFSSAPEHTGATGSKVGTILVLTETIIVAVVAHCPAAGVKV